MGGFTFNVGSVKATVLGLRNAKVSELEAARKAMIEAGFELQSALLTNVSARDHSPRDLAKLDHPYARRHGTIKIHRGGSSTLVNSTSLVHSQSGALKNSTFMETITGDGGLRDIRGIRVGLEDQAAPHAIFVVRGTRFMLPRDVVDDTFNASAVQRAVMRRIVRVFGEQFKAQAGIRFTKGSSKRAVATSTTKKF